MSRRRAVCHPAVPEDELPAVPSAQLCGQCGGRLPRVAEDRAETDPCQRGTVGCCVDHDGDEECETW